MTIRSFINFGQSFKTVAGINIHIHSNNVLSISYCILKLEKDIITVASHAMGICTIIQLEQELKKALPESSRIHINLEGSEILSKTSEINNDILTRSKALKKLFPMIKEEEFVSQLYSGKKFNFLNVVRKDFFNSLLKLNENFTAVSISLGPFVADQIFPLLGTHQLSLNGYRLTVEDNKLSEITLQSIDDSDVSVAIGEDSLPSGVLLAYASAWNILFKNSGVDVSSLPWIEETVVKYDINKNIYHTTKLALIVVLSFLMINTAFYFWLQSKTEYLSTQNILSSKKQNQTELHSKQLVEVLYAYDGIGWKSNTIPIYYADQIAKDITPEIQLTTLEIGVLNQAILKKEKKQSYQSNLINVKGATDTPVALRKWIGGLEQLPWIQSIIDQKYKHDSKLNKGFFEFYILIK